MRLATTSKSPIHFSKSWLWGGWSLKQVKTIELLQITVPFPSCLLIPIGLGMLAFGSPSLHIWVPSDESTMKIDWISFHTSCILMYFRYNFDIMMHHRFFLDFSTLIFSGHFDQLLSENDIGLSAAVRGTKVPSCSRQPEAERYCRAPRVLATSRSHSSSRYSRSESDGGKKKNTSGLSSLSRKHIEIAILG